MIRIVTTARLRAMQDLIDGNQKRGDDCERRMLRMQEEHRNALGRVSDVASSHMERSEYLDGYEKQLVDRLHRMVRAWCAERSRNSSLDRRLLTAHKQLDGFTALTDTEPTGGTK